ncbi:unnamed protein product [Hymenolepis diminuta]|uniref:Secreted protein n=1 Tax=Hymenolepis diminuta TaxID=6216 RepID=A0A0R3SLK8_HYMDI|nr:unnamed protein product [Hymenolepis diminuta]
MQLAVVDAAIVAARGGNSTYLGADAAIGSTVEIGDNQDSFRPSMHQTHHHHPTEHSTDAGIESGSSCRPTNASHIMP